MGAVGMTPALTENETQEMSKQQKRNIKEINF